MAGTITRNRDKLPGSYADLVRILLPRAISDETELDNMIEMINRVLAQGKRTRDQDAYLETLSLLVEAYESVHHAIDTSDITGLDMVHHFLEQHDMTASDLARVLGVHATMGAKILRGERSLTVAHIRKLSERFGCDPGIFIDEPSAKPHRRKK